MKTKFQILFYFFVLLLINKYQIVCFKRKRQDQIKKESKGELDLSFQIIPKSNCSFEIEPPKKIEKKVLPPPPIQRISTNITKNYTINITTRYEEIIIGNKEEYEKYHKQLEADRLENLRRMEQLAGLKYLKKIQNKPHPVPPHKPKHSFNLQVHLTTIQNFFHYLTKGFNTIQGKKEMVSYKNHSLELKEDFKVEFTCGDLGKQSVEFLILQELKSVVDKIDYKNYKKTMNDVTLILRKMVNSIKNKCQGLEYVIDVLDKYILHIKDGTLRPDYLININVEKNKAVSEMDKHSFSEAGFTLGKIYGEARKYSFFIEDKLDHKQKN